MFAHPFPLFVGQFPRLEQDRIRDAHLADVVEQRPPADVHQVGVADAHFAGQALGHFGDPQGVAFGLFVAQVQRPRPAFDGLVVGQDQIKWPGVADR